jgi:hypothetical protein
MQLTAEEQLIKYHAIFYFNLKYFSRKILDFRGMPFQEAISYALLIFNSFWNFKASKFQFS